LFRKGAKGIVFVVAQGGGRGVGRKRRNIGGGSVAGMAIQYVVCGVTIEGFKGGKEGGVWRVSRRVLYQKAIAGREGKETVRGTRKKN